MPRQEALATMLEDAADVYFFYKARAKKPTAKQLGEKLNEIEAAASKLLAAMSLPESIDEDDPLAGMPPAIRSALQPGAAIQADRLGWRPRYSGEGLLRNTVHGIYRLRDWAMAAGELHQRDDAAERTPRHEGDPALDALFRQLAEVYRTVFEGEPGASTSPRTGETTGPWVRFVKACLRPILAEADMPTDKAIRQRTRKAQVNCRKNSIQPFRQPSP
jgi:hypothetical protein